MVFFSLEMQIRLVQSEVYCRIFYSETKRLTKPLKAAAAKKSSPSVYIKRDKTCLDECFLFHVITGGYYFLYKFTVTQNVGEAVILLCSLKQVF